MSWKSPRRAPGRAVTRTHQQRGGEFHVALICLHNCGCQRWLLWTSAVEVCPSRNKQALFRSTNRLPVKTSLWTLRNEGFLGWCVIFEYISTKPFGEVIYLLFDSCVNFTQKSARIITKVTNGYFLCSLTSCQQLKVQYSRATFIGRFSSTSRFRGLGDKASTMKQKNWKCHFQLLFEPHKFQGRLFKIKYNTIVGHSR